MLNVLILSNGSRVKIKGFIDDIMEINYMELRLKFANQWPLLRRRIIMRNDNFHIDEGEMLSELMNFHSIALKF